MELREAFLHWEESKDPQDPPFPSDSSNRVLVSTKGQKHHGHFSNFQSQTVQTWLCRHHARVQVTPIQAQPRIKRYAFQTLLEHKEDARQQISKPPFPLLFHLQQGVSQLPPRHMHQSSAPLEKQTPIRERVSLKHKADAFPARERQVSQITTEKEIGKLQPDRKWTLCLLLPAQGGKMSHCLNL